MDPSLTVCALEAHGTEAEGGAKPVHTGTPIEARGWREGAVRAASLAWNLSHTAYRTPPTLSKHQLPVSSFFKSMAQTHPEQGLHPLLAQPQDMVVLTRSTVVGASLAVAPSVAWRAGAGVAPRAGAAGATIETGP